MVILILLSNSLNFERKFDIKREEITVTTVIVESHAAATLTDITLVKRAIPDTLEALLDFREALWDQGRRRLNALKAQDSANHRGKARMRMPQAYIEGSRYPYDYSDYSDDSQLVAVRLAHVAINRQPGEPQSVRCTTQLLRQWELYDLPKSLFLLEKGSFARDIPGTAPKQVLRQELTIRHPWVIDNASVILQSLIDLKVATEYAHAELR